MNRLLVAAAVILGLGVVCQTAQAASAFENCVVVRATADARNPQVSTDRALHRLHRYIAEHLRSPGGKTVGPTSTHCIRNACEASAIVCHH